MINFRNHKTVTIAIIIIIALIIIISIFLPVNNIIYDWIRDLNNKIYNLRAETLNNFSNKIDNYIQFIPLVILFILKIYGLQGLLKWKNLLLFIFLSFILTQAVVNILKFSALEIRPDSSDFLSFPSGHSATAFMCATILFLEYNHHKKSITVIGYLCAITVGIMRILNNRHWLFDVLIGAILGIILAYVSYLIVLYFFKSKEK